MVQAISGFNRPYVSAVPSVTQQERINQIKLERNEVIDNLINGNISDMQAMSERVSLDARLSDARAAQASSMRGVEVIGVDRISNPNSISIPQNIQPTNVSAIKRQAQGKELSYAEKQQMLEKQMNQMAINNQVLHGLVAV